MKWYGARTLFSLEREGVKGSRLLEHRVVLVHARDSDEAIELAEAEGKEHQRSLRWINGEGARVLGRYLNICDVFELSAVPGHEVEVYSAHVLERSDASLNELVDIHFGPEREGEVQEEMDKFAPDIERTAKFVESDSPESPLIDSSAAGDSSDSEKTDGDGMTDDDTRPKD